MAEQLSLVNRRNILLGIAGGAVTVSGLAVQQSGGAEAFAELLRRPVGLGRSGVFLATASRDDWAIQVGTQFTASTGHVLKLVAVQGFPVHGPRPAGSRSQAFSAKFDVTSGGPLAEAQILTVSHEEGGTFDIFMTGGNPAKPLRMLAIFG